MHPDRIGSNTASLPNFSLTDALDTLHKMGFRTVELLAFDGFHHSQGRLAGFWFDELTPKQKDELRSAVASFDHIATHLPFVDVPLFSYNRRAAALAKEQLKAGIEGTGFLGGETATMHVCPRSDLPLKAYWGRIVDTLRELGDWAARWNVKLAIETMFPPRISEFVGLVYETDHPNVGANIDVGHIRSCADLEVSSEERGTEEAERRFNQCLKTIVREVGPKLFHIHLHDVRRGDWRDHRAVGRGIIDFEALFRQLHEQDYPYLLTFELEEPDVISALSESRAYVLRLIQSISRR